MRVTTRNARFQQWAALLANRTKRQKLGSFLVQGVRPITMAVRHGWELREILYDADARLSEWARSLLDSSSPAARVAPAVAVAGELMRELGEKDEPVELLAVVAIPPDDLARVVRPRLVVVFDRPTSPGNIGTLVRSADAFAADGLVVTGHAADVYDPKAVRASTGSLFALPVVRAASPAPVLAWARERGLTVVGTDERATTAIAEHDFTRPTLLLVGNETTGLSEAWRSACDAWVRIPMAGSASSLNAATAASIVLYEAARQTAAPSSR